MKTLPIIVPILLALVCIANAADPTHRITSLPGLARMPSYAMYSGYINVDPVEGKEVFYWFIEAAKNPQQAPLLVWLNGGPGASSLLGLFTENGPFRPSADGTLMDNPYSWNLLANMIFIEAPIGVGFSYAKNPSYPYYSNDSSTARDNYVFIQNWFKKFPEYRTNEFYITGESYGGKYVPTFADLVLENNLNGPDPKINMKGLMIGNPGLDGDYFYYRNEYAFVNFMYSHALIPQSNYTIAQTACGWDQFLLQDSCSTSFNSPTADCVNAVSAALSYVPNDVDLYGIYFPFCNEPSPSAQSFTKYTSWTPLSKHLASTPFFPCTQNYLVNYLNLPSVQAAIHAKPTHWNWVSSILKYGRRDADMSSLFQRFFRDAPDWRIQIYSGDADAAVPWVATQRWVDCLGRRIVKDWNFWRHNKQVQGAYKIYDGVTLVSVKGCGHMVPYYCPEAAYVMFMRYINKMPMQ